MNAYVIDHERYGEETAFDTIEEAQETVRACGADFANVTLSVHGIDIVDDLGEIVGRVVPHGTDEMSDTTYTRRHEAAERIAMRHWLSQHGIQPVMGDEPSHTERLMKQVVAAGGDPGPLMRQGREAIDAKIEADYQFQERAAIMEYDGGLSRAEAEATAKRALVRED